MKTRDSLHAEYVELEGQLRGISPKLSLHAQISAKMRVIKDELGGEVKSEKHRGPKEINSLNGTRIKVREGGIDHGQCSHARVEKCKVPSCSNKTKGTGKCSSCGKSRYLKYCRRHNGADFTAETKTNG